MRRFYWFLLLLVMCTALPKASQALQLGIGASTWFAEWKFDSKGDKGGDTVYGPDFVYGPVLTLGFTPEWSLSGVFLYGVFENSTENGPKEISRFDSDIALNYSISTYLKIFLGFKYMGYEFEENSMEGSHTSYGPGVGISLVAPLAENLYLLCTLSGLYLRGTHEDPGSEYDYNEPGFNASAAIAYRFAGASTVISLGGRYQYFTTMPDSSDADEMAHTFYGVTLSAIYSFSM